MTARQAAHVKVAKVAQETWPAQVARLLWQVLHQVAQDRLAAAAAVAKID